MKYVPPSIHETSFNCPHCGALAHQYWWRLRGHKLPDGETPSFDDGRPLFGNLSRFDTSQLMNVAISQCFNCKELSIWNKDRMIYPQRGEAPPANPDLPDDIRRDYDEASSILDLSPRGAAALIRLAIQKLCKHLGKPGKNINDDIAALVADGLDSKIQKALDAIRVIGNDAVHPGKIDLRDDRTTAENLFRWLNLIAERMISEPKSIDEAYAALPEANRLAIEKRDGKATP